MNDYTEIGNYYCNANSIAQTLENCPTTSGFTLKVENAVGESSAGSSGYIRQTFTEYDTGRKIVRYRVNSTSTWQPFVYFSDDATKIPCSNITYSSDNKESAMNLVNNPTKIFGERDTPYCIIFNDSAGDSIFSGGKSAIFGYTYYNDTHGAQLIMRYGMKLQYRTKTSGTWAGLRDVTLS